MAVTREQINKRAAKLFAQFERNMKKNPKMWRKLQRIAREEAKKPLE